MASPPSNGEMGRMWTAIWCDRCIHDHAASHVGPDVAQYEDGCPLLGRMYMSPQGTDFPELRESQEPTGGWNPEKLECLLFDRCPCEDDPGWEPVPTPDPNQGALFDMLEDSPVTPGGVVIPTADVEVRA